jgi:hypothetical protein
VKARRTSVTHARTDLDRAARSKVVPPASWSRAGRPHRLAQRDSVGRGTWTLAEMRQRVPNWREDVERERGRRVERGLPPQIEDISVLSAIAEIIRFSEVRQREQAERVKAATARSRR